MNYETKTSPFKFAIGQTVTWTSQAQGSDKTKTGIIQGLISPGITGKCQLESKMKLFNFRFDANRLVSSNPRYLIEVEKYHKLTDRKIKSTWYAPSINDIEDANELR